MSHHLDPEFLQVLNNWMIGETAEKKRLGRALKLHSKKLDPRFREAPEFCYRQITLSTVPLMQLATSYKLPETISSWSCDYGVTKVFKVGVPPKDEIGIIVRTRPVNSQVIVNIDRLFHEREFKKQLARLKGDIEHFHEGLGKFKNAEREVVLEISDFEITDVFAWGGYSSTVDVLTAMYLQKTPTESEIQMVKKMLSKKRVKAGAKWEDSPEAAQRIVIIATTLAPILRAKHQSRSS